MADKIELKPKSTTYPIRACLNAAKNAAGYKSKRIFFECALIEADWEWEEVLTMQTWISLLAENEGSQVMDTECSKEKFFTTYKRLSCLHTSSTVRLWTRRKKTKQMLTRMEK